jgi:rod shape-determining protein MreC
LLRLPYLTNNADVEKGDLLVSSGLGGVFPAGYPVGRISEIRLRPDQSFAEIMAEPASALDRDREVLLVWNAADDAPHANEPAAAQGTDVAKAPATEAASLAKAK